MAGIRICLAYPLEQIEDNPRGMAGKVVTIVFHKGYFFIRGEDGMDYFAHISTLDLPRMFYDLRPEDDVAFEPLSGDKGLRALRVWRSEARTPPQTLTVSTSSPHNISDRRLMVASSRPA
jgi:cold shock CspA family protein